MEEVTQKVKRSELYNEIYAIVKQIPRANVDSDCMDASSASVAIEKLIASRDSRILSAVPSEEREEILKDIFKILEEMDIEIDYGEPSISGKEMEKTAKSLFNIIVQKIEERDIAG